MGIKIKLNAKHMILGYGVGLNESKSMIMTRKNTPIFFYIKKTLKNDLLKNNS